MKEKIFSLVIGIFILVLTLLASKVLLTSDELSNTIEMVVTVVQQTQEQLTVQDENDIIYTFRNKCGAFPVGEILVIEYAGILDRNQEIQKGSLINCELAPVSQDEENEISTLNDNGIFQEYYTLANNKLQTLSLDEKIAQLLLVRFPDNQAIELLEQYKFGGYVFYEKDFSGKTKTEVQDLMTELQSVSDIPILTAVDEEGGKVVRVSSNPNLVSSKFLSSQELYQAGGFSSITEDTKNKSNILYDLGLNLNLAPVVDVSENSSDYMYERTLGQNTSLTSTYAKTVIEASKGTGVSYTLKHFPGYGNNADTHLSTSIDNRSYDDIKNNDLPPFQAGIDAGAEAVLVSHNTVNSIDSSNPASLSPSVHNLLRNELGFTGVIISDDLAMGAISNIDQASVKALIAGNDLIITTDYLNSFNEIKQAVQDGTISASLIDKLATKVIAWKYYKGLMFEYSK